MHTPDGLVRLRSSLWVSKQECGCCVGLIALAVGVDVNLIDDEPWLMSCAYKGLGLNPIVIKLQLVPDIEDRATQTIEQNAGDINDDEEIDDTLRESSLIEYFASNGIFVEFVD